MMPDAFARTTSSAEQNDLRFQFKVIEGLSESVRDMARVMADMQKTQVGMLERLARLEANTTSETLKVHAAKLDAQETRLDQLFADRSEREGVKKMFDGLRAWWPILISLGGAASIFSALWLAGRSVGVVPAPPAPTARVEATIQRDERSIEGTVGGKPK